MSVSPSGMSNHQILFKDSSDPFEVPNSRVVFPTNAVAMFLVFTDNGEYVRTDYFPMMNIHRIRRTPMEAS